VEQQIRKPVDVSQRRAQVMRDRVAETFQLAHRAFEFGSSAADTFLEFGV
jgi:hypothetical protein